MICWTCGFCGSGLPKRLVPSSEVIFGTLAREILSVLCCFVQVSWGIICQEVKVTLPTWLAPNSEVISLTYSCHSSWAASAGSEVGLVMPSKLALLLAKRNVPTGAPASASKRKVSKQSVKKHANSATAQPVGAEVVTAETLWRRFGQRWRNGPGSHVLPSHVGGCSRRHVWLEWRMGGMGCSLCHWFWQSFQESKARSRQKRFCTKWGRFGIKEVASMQSSAIRLHACSEVHQTAWQSFCNPTLAPQLVTLSDEDAHLLKGGVPQASDWLRLWKAVTSTSLSLRSLQELSFTDSFVSCDRVDPKAVTREAYLNMVNIFVDLLREEKRDLLKRARAIAISTDDKSV